MPSFANRFATRRAARRERMKADYLIEPATTRERWRVRRAERWLVYDSLGGWATSLEDSRERADEARAKWRHWRAVQLGHEIAVEPAEDAGSDD
jgi:hypothetical protein